MTWSDPQHSGWGLFFAGPFFIIAPLAMGALASFAVAFGPEAPIPGKPGHALRRQFLHGAISERAFLHVPQARFLHVFYISS